jgi:hypothetical protein
MYMTQKISKNGVGLLILLGTLLGLDIDEVVAENVTAAAGVLLSFALMVWNQLDRKDLKWGLFRK